MPSSFVMSEARKLADRRGGFIQYRRPTGLIRLIDAWLLGERHVIGGVISTSGSARVYQRGETWWRPFWRKLRWQLIRIGWMAHG